MTVLYPNLCYNEVCYVDTYSLHMSWCNLISIFLTGQGVNKSVNRAWIGLNDRPSEGTFSWLDEQNLSFRRNFS